MQVHTDTAYQIQCHMIFSLLFTFRITSSISHKENCVLNTIHLPFSLWRNKFLIQSTSCITQIPSCSSITYSSHIKTRCLYINGNKMLTHFLSRVGVKVQVIIYKVLLSLNLWKKLDRFGSCSHIPAAGPKTIYDICHLIPTLLFSFSHSWSEVWLALAAHLISRHNFSVNDL